MISTFFIKPTSKLDNNNSFTGKVKELIISYLLFFIIAGCFNGLIKILDYFIYQKMHFSFIEAMQNQQKIGLKKLSVLFIILIGPLMEELIFRLPLKINKVNISISLSVLCVYCIGDKLIDINLYSALTWIKLIPIILIFSVIYFIKIDAALNKIQTRYYTLYFYALSIAFGLMHILNFYKVVPNNLLILSPIFVISLIFLGILLSYIRIRLGFIWAIFAHCFFNFLVTILVAK